MSNILKNVDIADLIVVNVYKGKPQVGDPNPFIVAVDPIDQTKKVVFDESSLKVLNARLTEKLKDADSTNPNTVQYIKEFATKMVSEFYKNGLLEIVDIPDSPEDPYELAKRAIQKGRT
jgi:hypothetical protein